MEPKHVWLSLLLCKTAGLQWEIGCLEDGMLLNPKTTPHNPHPMSTNNTVAPPGHSSALKWRSTYALRFAPQRNWGPSKSKISVTDSKSLFLYFISQIIFIKCWFVLSFYVYDSICSGRGENKL